MLIFTLTLIAIGILDQAEGFRPLLPFALLISIFAQNIEVFLALLSSSYILNENFQEKFDLLLTGILKAVAKLIWRMFLKFLKMILYVCKIIIKNAVNFSASAVRFFTHQIAA